MLEEEVIAVLDFRVETFLAVCQTENFTRAAQLLHITQPAVSQHIHALEEQYGAKLFRYEGKQLFLTPAGRLLQQTAATMRHDARHLEEEIRQLSARREIHFGATLTIGEYLMPGVLCRLLEREPDLQLRMTAANTAELETVLLGLKEADDICEESYAIRDTVLAAMSKLRVVCDEAETVTAEKYWPFPTYGDLLFGVK